MPDKWTSDLIADMHVHRITRIQLADKLSYTPEYVSMVLNGKREPKNAEQVLSLIHIFLPELHKGEQS